MTPAHNGHADGAVPGNRWDLLDDVQPASAPSVSVIVAHYRQPAQLARTLLAIERQRYPAHLVEVIVVDDGSPEPPQVPESVTLLSQPDLGFRLAAARNRGAEAATHEVLVFLDADTAPEPDYLRHLVRLPALSWDAVVVGRRRHADLGSSPLTADLHIAGERNELAEPPWLIDAYQRSGNLLTVDFRSYRYVIGAVIACTRRFFDVTGGFDESFTRYGGEDWEWAYRAWLQGALLAHVPSAVAWHDGADQAGREALDLARKNAEALTLAELIPVPGSRGRGIVPARADVVVRGPAGDATPGQVFVSRDSVLAAIPGAVWSPATERSGEGFDRVRVEVVIEHPVRASAGSLAEAIGAIDSGAYSGVTLRFADGSIALRLLCVRSARRVERWGDAARLPVLDLAATGIAPLVDEVDVEGYTGGWA